MIDYIFYMDGVCLGNFGFGGWGVFILQGKFESEICGGELDMINNCMEFIVVIEVFKQMFEDVEIMFYMDLKYVMDGFMKWMVNWKKNGWKIVVKKVVKNEDLWCEFDSLVLV